MLSKGTSTSQTIHEANTHSKRRSLKATTNSCWKLDTVRPKMLFLKMFQDCHINTDLTLIWLGESNSGTVRPLTPEFCFIQ